MLSIGMIHYINCKTLPSDLDYVSFGNN